MLIYDDGKGELGPMTDLRAAFEIRTGVMTTAERICRAWPDALTASWVPPRLVDVVRERAAGNVLVNRLPQDDPLMLVNGRWAFPDASQRLSEGEVLLERDTDEVVVALLRRGDADRFLHTGELPAGATKRPLGKRGDRVLYHRPWDVIAWMKQTIPQDIVALGSDGGDSQRASDIAAVVGGGAHPVHIARSAKICPNVTFDAENGPILIAEQAVIRPGSVLVGPCAIGADSTVIDRAFIKANTVIGPHCKAAGEVGGTIFQGYSNKAHDGHLGNSWVGEWVNFGAGTTNSNLLNTYGEVVMRLEPDAPRQRTGLQFLGAVVGDHVKFAICTRIMTGSIIGTGAMIASTAAPPTTVKRFAWLTDEGERSFRLDKFLEIAKTVMARRHVTPSEAYVKAVTEIHAQGTQKMEFQHNANAPASHRR